MVLSTNMNEVHILLRNQWVPLQKVEKEEAEAAVIVELKSPEPSARGF